MADRIPVGALCPLDRPSPGFAPCRAPRSTALGTLRAAPIRQKGPGKLPTFIAGSAAQIFFFPLETRGIDRHHARLPADSENTTVGRPPLLSPQPDKPVTAPIQRHQFFVRLRSAVLESGRGGADCLDGVDDQPANRSFLLRAEGL